MALKLIKKSEKTDMGGNGVINLAEAIMLLKLVSSRLKSNLAQYQNWLILQMRFVKRKQPEKC
jgi:hypothetical protein